jgi:hypothetical protein
MFSGHHGSGRKSKCAILRISKREHLGLFNCNWVIRRCWICIQVRVDDRRLFSVSVENFIKQASVRKDKPSRNAAG